MEHYFYKLHLEITVRITLVTAYRIEVRGIPTTDIFLFLYLIYEYKSVLYREWQSQCIGL